MILVRPERPEEHSRVEALQEAAFGRPTEARLLAALREAAEPQLSLVGEADGALLGHVFFSPVTLAPASATPPLAALGPVGVAPAEQGRGVGSALVREGLRACRDAGWEAVFLVGNPRFYARFGFRLAGPLGFTYGHPHLDAVLQAVELVPGALRGLTGRVVFAPPFAATDPD